MRMKVILTILHVTLVYAPDTLRHLANQTILLVAFLIFQDLLTTFSNYK